MADDKKNIPDVAPPTEASAPTVEAAAVAEQLNPEPVLTDAEAVMLEHEGQAALFEMGEAVPDSTDAVTYACDAHTADAEFLLSKREYLQFTGRKQDNDVIAYQVRQSFKPGEITPEEAHKVGYEFAARFLKGKHAFIVCTHTDKKHIHNHIIWNSTALDCKHKFRDFSGSWRALARLSDLICISHQLSVVQQPTRYAHTHYGKWLGNHAKPSHREQVRTAIDAALSRHPHTFDAFLELLRQDGYIPKPGKHLALCKDGQKAIRLDSLKDGYTEDAIRALNVLREALKVRCHIVLRYVFGAWGRFPLTSEAGTRRLPDSRDCKSLYKHLPCLPSVGSRSRRTFRRVRYSVKALAPPHMNKLYIKWCQKASKKSEYFPDIWL